MRLDKFLKVSRLVKRRTVAQQACDGGRVSVGGRTAKPSYDVKVGDTLEISFGASKTRVRVVKLCDYIKAEDAATMYEIME